MLEDGSGRPFRFGGAFDGRHPVVLALVYYDCPMLCGLILSGLAKAMRENGLELGKDYQAITVSFDPDEKPIQGAERRRGYLQSMGRTDAGPDWPFLVGTAAATRRLSDAVGFYFKKDEVSGEWAHMAAVFVLTPDGKVSRYLYGIEYAPKDLRLSLVEAAEGKIGTAVDQVLLYCYQYDAATGRYGAAVMRLLRTLAAVTVVGLLTFIAVMLRRERHAPAGAA
jgi:protein SCO1/2